MGKIFDIITKEFMVVFIATLPLIELRGAIPIGVSLGMHPIHAMILGVLGNLVPIPFLLYFMEPVFNYLKSIGILQKILDKIVLRTLKKSDNIRKYSIWGLVLFVALPLPTTGIWSGCLAATLFNIPAKDAFFAMTLGAIIAGSIMLTISYGIILW